MSDMQASASGGPFSALRRFVREKASIEFCDFCSAGLAAEHQHLIEPEQRSLICVCDACAILFSSGGETKYRRVPRRVSYLPDFRLTDAQWESLMIPIGLVFFFQSSVAKKVVALYPSPAGPTESLLDFAAWEEIAQDNPILRKMEADVEALLVNRVDRMASMGRMDRPGGAPEYFIAPIDECFKLVGLIRVNWRGLSGGEEVWKETGRFFADLKSRAIEVRPDRVREESHA
jgi:hypothetical protein